jgi:uncharacterized ion transporter superfamily protein YfcC
MGITWVIIGVFSIFVIAFLIYLVTRNKKDEKEMIDYLNETEMDEESQEEEMNNK